MIPNRKLSKAETKAYSTFPILTKEDGTPINVEDLTQGIDYEITKDGTVTTDIEKIRKIAKGRALIADGTFLQLDKIDKEKADEIRRKGQAKATEIKRQRKTISEICNNLLSISATDLADKVVDGSIADKIKNTDLTLYDLIVAKMIEESMHGNVKASTFIRDSAGDKPIDKSEVTAEVVTDADREMLERIAHRLEK